MSAVAVSGGKAMTLVQKDGKQWLLALDAKTGKTLWETPLAVGFENQMGNGPRGTPAIAGDRVYVGSNDGRFYVLDLNDGTKLWEFDAGAALSASPAIANGRIVIGSQDGRLYCFG